MSRLLTAWVLGAASLAVAASLLGEHMDIGTATDTTGEKVLTLAVVAAVFTLVNQVVAPIVKTLSLPFIILTLGLALLVINALLLLLTEWITRNVGVPFSVDGFWWAVLASIIISLVNGFLGSFARR